MTSLGLDHGRVAVAGEEGEDELRGVVRVPDKEIYKGESKEDNNQTKKYCFILHLKTLPSQLLQLQLSLSNEMTDQLL